MRSVTYLLQDFGPLVVFFVLNYFWNLKIAIAGLLLWVLVALFVFYIRGIKCTRFFLFSSSLAIVFGCFDLLSENILLIKYEAAVQSFFIGGFFALSLSNSKKPIIQEFAERQGRIKENDISDDLIHFFRILTFIWVFYYFAKGLIYIWMGAMMPLEKAMIIRSTFGNASFYGLLFASIFLAQPLYSVCQRLKVLPSTKTEADTGLL